MNAEARLDARIAPTAAGPVLQVNGVPTAPTIFFVNFDTDPALRPLQLDEMRTAGKHGVRIVSFPLTLPWPEDGAVRDFAFVDSRVEEVLKANPDALLLPRTGVTWPPQWWVEGHQDDVALHNDGTRGIASVHSRLWRRTAFDNLKAMVEHIERKFGDHVIGYHPCGQETGEWFYEKSWQGVVSGLEPPARVAFKDYVRRRYGSDEKLQAAWHDPDITLDCVEVPSVRDQTRCLAGAFRDPAAERGIIDYFEFRNEEMADTVELMCRAVKEAAPNKLAVTFYGYIFEVACIPRGLQASGHLALGRLLQSPYVDVICSPGSYSDRGPGGGGYFMAPVDSVQLHGKLWLMEDDTRTHLGGADTGYGLYRMKDARETRGVLERNFAHVLTHGAAVWWMDLFGVGWFSGDEIWSDLSQLQQVYTQGLRSPEKYHPEIALIVDERSSLYAAPSPGVLAPLLNGSREQWYRVGAPLGIYLLSDLVAGKVPPAKLYVFLNAFTLDDRQIQALRTHAFRRGSTVLWMHAPGIVNGDTLSPDRISSLTGIRVKTDAASFVVDDRLARPTAYRLGDDGIVEVASKKMEGWTSVYSAALQIPTDVLRAIARQAGVHIYSDQNDVVMAGNGFVALHASSDGVKRLSMVRGCSAVDCLTGANLGRAVVFEFEMKRGDTKLLRIVD